MSLAVIAVSTALTAGVTLYSAYEAQDTAKEVERATTAATEKADRAIEKQRQKEENARKQTIMRMQKRRGATTDRTGRRDVRTPQTQGDIGAPKGAGKRLLGE